MSEPKRPRKRALDLIERLKREGGLSAEDIAASSLTDKDLELLRLYTRSSDRKMSLILGRAQRLRTKANETSADLVPVEQVPALTRGDALVHWIDERTLIAFGNTDALREYGKPLQDLSPAMIERFKLAASQGLAGGNAALQAASTLQGLKQAGTVYRVAEKSIPLLQKYGMTQSGGQAIGVVRSNGQITHLVRWDAVGSGLRTMASLSAFAVALAHFAGQAQMQKTLSEVCRVVQKLEDRETDQRVSEVVVAQEQLSKVLRVGAEVGTLTPALEQQLPDPMRLREHVRRSERELDRLLQAFDGLPMDARRRNQALQAAAPDVILSLAVYSHAETSLSAVEQVWRATWAERGDPAAALLTEIELKAQQRRAAKARSVARRMTEAMEALEASPGKGWFKGSTRAEIRRIAGDVKRDVATIADRYTDPPWGCPGLTDRVDVVTLLA